VKLPLCDFVMLRSAPLPIVVGSDALLLAPSMSPPPMTVAVLMTFDAVGATLTVSVIAG
jgi:hypothetical protein